MATDQHASVSVRDGAVEVTGSEEFVAQQLENLRPWLERMLTTPAAAPAPPPPEGPVNSSAQRAAVSIPQNRFENVLAFEDGRVNVLQIPPSSKRSEQAIATALIYLWGKLQLGISDVPFSEIRQVCRSHGCLDESNFAGHLKSAKTELIINGSGKSQSAKLSVPGQRRALALIEQLNNPPVA